jgi:hypothetical protein
LTFDLLLARFAAGAGAGSRAGRLRSSTILSF